MRHLIINMTIAVAMITAWAGLQSEAIAGDATGTIEVGAAQVGIDSPSAKFMEYGGGRNNGTYLTGAADLSYNDNGFYLHIQGKDLGLDTRDIRLESGKYGRYKFFMEYDQLPHYLSSYSKTIFDGAGSANLTLPAGYNRTAAYPKTLPDQIINGTNGIGGYGNMKDVELKLERKDMSTGFSLTSLKGLLDFNLSFKRDKKDGIKSVGATVVSKTGYPEGSVVLPEPVDYTTDEIRASVAYNREKAQLALEYYLSTFDNANESLTWQNPYYYGAANPVISLPPSNKYQQVTLSGGVSLPASTRVSMSAEYGKMTQDESYLPYSQATPAIMPNATSPNAAIETKLLNLNISSRPVNGLGLNAKYRHYDTVNLTPVNLYQYFTADGQNTVTIKTSGTGPAGSIYANGNSASGLTCSASNPCYSGFTSSAAAQGALNSTNARYNTPYDYAQDQAKLDASYLVVRNTTLSIGYDRDIMTRSHRQTSTTTEDSYRAGIKSFGSYAAVGGNYLKGEKRSDKYDPSSELESYTQAYYQTLKTGVDARTWIDHPDLKEADVADRNRERYVAYVTLFPLNIATVGLNYSHGKDNFTDTIFGLKDINNDTYTVDLSVSPSDTITMYTYYTNDRNESNQAGRAIKTPNVSTTNNSTYDWAVNNDDRTDTVGAGFTFQFLKGKLTINPDYTYSKSKTSIGVIGGSAIAATIKPVPDLDTERNTVKITTKYKLTESMTIGAAYLYENYSSSDWATDNVTPSNTSSLPANVVPLSGSEPSYTANVGTITLAYKW